MKLVQSFLTRNPCYTAGKRITVKGLMLHSVGCPQPRASVFLSSWNRPDFASACVHGFIDGNDGTAYQTLPWEHRGWHCGSGRKGSGNNTHIGIEMCEPACIRYTSGSNFTCSDKAAAKAVAKRTHETAVELFAMLCKKFHLDPLADGVIISHKEGHSRGIASNHGDPEHLWTQLGMGYTMDGFRRAVKAAMGGTDTPSGLQASVFADLSEKEVIAKAGALFTADMKHSGILASISFAQFILESGYGKSELAQKANNVFGMKKSLSGNTWGGSAWDGASIYTKETQEYENGAYVTVTADFRKYPSVEKSIADHSAYLLGAKNGSRLRYEGLKGCTDYRKAAQIIKDGGYATSPDYVGKLCSIIERWNLTQYDTAGEEEIWYRVRKTWADKSSQKGAFHGLENAKKCADANVGYFVFDESGTAIYPEASAVKVPYTVRVKISDLNIRKGPGTDYARVKYIPVGVYTIVEEADGKGASKWGRLKSGIGWISLDYAVKC
ncbi:glucosaminidase domain-containing protein [[Clostridium] symbiosum]|uniref:glucosaminidase domain-containing protein n=1 Tax=Clostridium symbiosum TaxID=1512 RepID=UPI003312FB83